MSTLLIDYINACSLFLCGTKGLLFRAEIQYRKSCYQVRVSTSASRLSAVNPSAKRNLVFQAYITVLYEAP